ncbi:MAG: PAS domain S-box protein [Halodesulfurarchaeum sp.]
MGQDLPDQCFKTAATMMIVLDTDGRIRRINDRACDVLGYDREELIGEEWFSTVVPEDTDLTLRDIFDRVQSAESGDVDVHENRVVSKSGDVRIVKWHNSLIYDDSGDITGLLGSGSDITERKDAERRLNRYRQAVESSPTMLDALDTDYQYLFANRAYREFHGIPMDRDISTVTQEEVHGEDWHEEIKPYVDRVHEGESIRYEMTRTNAEGDDRTLDIRYFPLRDDEDDIKGNVAAMRDITDRKRHEQELQETNERLDEFASLVSHDLRNPLNIAQGRATLVAQECDTDHVDSLIQALDRMGEILEETLRLAREGARIGDTRSVDLSSVVKQSWEMTETKSARLQIEEECTLRGDPDRLRHLFENLIRNAVEHGGESVTVRVGRCGEETLFFEDDGPGIPEEHREDVFEPGFSTEREGEGFGLPIVREIAQGHGWSVSVTDGDAGGARFEFSGVTIE